jgi:hypothetical protein
MPSARHFARSGRIGLLLAALAPSILLLAPMAASADDKPATQKPLCWHPAIVNGHHVQPGRAELDKCPSGALHDVTPPAPGSRSSAGERPPIDADEAFIMDVIKRYAVQP